jgi:cob(I)alamin adenosyltransferase
VVQTAIFVTMGILKQLAEYLYLRKKDPERPKTGFIKYMHGINRLSILLFIVAMIILAIKLLRHR